MIKFDSNTVEGGYPFPRLSLALAELVTKFQPAKIDYRCGAVTEAPVGFPCLRSIISMIRSAAPRAVITMLSHAGAPGRPSQFQSFSRGAARIAVSIAKTRLRPSSTNACYHIRLLFAYLNLPSVRCGVQQNFAQSPIHSTPSCLAIAASTRHKSNPHSAVCNRLTSR
jgi:hypothetical protein